jgi:hypothetical protein
MGSSSVSSALSAIFNKLLHPLISPPEGQEAAVVLKSFGDVGEIELITDTQAIMGFTKIWASG